MKTKLMVIALLGAFSLTAGAEEFYLKHDKTGKVYGPFDTTSGSKVAIGTTTFAVVAKKTKSEAENKLSEIKIPQVELRSAAFQDAIQFLRIQTQRLDPKKTGVNFVIAKLKSKKKKSSDPSGDFGGGFDMGPMVTLSMKDVSALEVLKSLMKQTGYTYKTLRNTVTIYPTK